MTNGPCTAGMPALKIALLHEGGGMRGYGRRFVAISAAVLLAALTLNVVGVLRYPGGPLRDATDAPLWLDLPMGNVSSSRVDLGQAADRDLLGTAVYYGVPNLTNTWPLSATIEAITPLEPKPGLIVEGIYVSRPGSNVSGIVGYDAGLPAGQTFEETYAGLPAAVDPSGSGPVSAATTLIVVHVDRPGVIGFSGFSVDYRVGPFTFRTVKHAALGICVPPFPAGATCPSP